MGMVKEQAEFLRDVAKFIEHCFSAGYELTAGEMWRPMEMQKVYFDSGRSKTMKSSHLDRLAVDFNVFKDGKLVEMPYELGKYWEGLNEKNRWGGSWRGLVESGKSKFIDKPHFERKA